MCGEKLVDKKARPDGTVVYTWKETMPNHDALDSIGQALAAYASFGYSNGDTGRTSMAAHKQRFPKKKIRFV